MSDAYPHELLEDVEELAGLRGWNEEVYRDILATQRGELSEFAFREKYCWRRAILSLDMTGFTATTMRGGEMDSLLRIFNAQKVSVPVLREYGSHLMRCFADDIVALFEDPNAALDAAFEIHRRIALFNASDLASDHPAECCVGIGYGQILAIGPNLAQGDEMNKASKLGEDIARATETLLTEQAHDALSSRSDVVFERQTLDDQIFPFFQATLTR